VAGLCQRPARDAEPVGGPSRRRDRTRYRRNDPGPPDAVRIAGSFECFSFCSSRSTGDFAALVG